MSAIPLNAARKELSPPLSHSLLKAVPVVAAVLQGESLTSSLKRAVDGLSSTSKFDDAEDTFASTTTMTAAVRDLCYNTLRDYGVVDALCANLARGELEPVVRALALAACGEMFSMLHAAREAFPEEVGEPRLRFSAAFLEAE